MEKNSPMFNRISWQCTVFCLPNVCSAAVLILQYLAKYLPNHFTRDVLVASSECVGVRIVDTHFRAIWQSKLWFFWIQVVILSTFVNITSSELRWFLS